MVFSLIENYSNTSIREFLLVNFKLAFETNQTIPIGILLEPLLKHMQSKDTAAFSINIFDIEFFNIMTRHAKFSETHALQLFYVIADVYLNNIAFYKESHGILHRAIKSSVT